MPVYECIVDYVKNQTIIIEAPDEATARVMIENATDDQIAHLTGKSFAQSSEAIVNIVSVTEIP